MRIALVHDYIKEYGGAERVLEALHELYPDAPVYTSVYLPSYLGPHRERFKDWKIRTSWAQYIPFKAKLISPLRILSPFLFRSFDFSKYDVVIVSATGAYFPNSRSKKQEARSKKPVMICYCHTPPRYLYGYATAREWKKHVVFRVIGAIANHILRIVDFHASENVDYYISNSEEVKKRIQKFYRREATVIYPPVDLDRAKAYGSKGASVQNAPEHSRSSAQYFLAGGRLARPKHIGLIIDACVKLKVPLKIFGRGFAGYEEELESRITNHESRIEFVGEVSDEEKFELMEGAKAFLFASEDEDFGITPVEAMSVGTPVIAYRSGGVKETVLHGNPSTGRRFSEEGSGHGTGIFFDELSVKSLIDAVKKFEKTKIKPEDCINQAKKFSKERFLKQIDAFIRQKTK